MEEVKPKDMEKYEIEYRNIANSSSGLFGLSEFRRKHQDPSFLNSPPAELSIEHLMKEFKLVVLENFKFEDRDL